MSIASIASYVFLGSIFGVLALWGYWPDAWAATWPAYTLLALAAVAMVLWVIFSIEGIALWLKKRSTQFGIGLALTAVASLAILGALNWYAVVHNKKWDVTANKMHSLSPQSKKIAGELTQKITIRVWSQNLQAMSGSIDLRDFLENYKIASHDKIVIEVKNPVDGRIEAMQDNIKRDNVIIIRSESGRESRIENYNDSKAEEQITNGIVQAVKGGKKTVCFLTGHGEFSINAQEPKGLSTVRDALSGSSYTPREFGLAENRMIPTECEAVLIIGPKGDASDQEMAIIMDYLKGGGKMLALLGAGTTEKWRKFALGFGVEVKQDYLIDLGSNPVSLVATKNYAEDVEITKGFGEFVLLMDSSSLSLPTQTTKGEFDVKAFVSSRDKVIAIEGDIRKVKSIRPTASDFKGPLPLAVLVTRPADNKPKADEGAPEVPPPQTDEPTGWNKIELPGVIAIAQAQGDTEAMKNHVQIDPVKTAESQTTVPAVSKDALKKLSLSPNPKIRKSAAGEVVTADTPNGGIAKPQTDGKMELVIISNSLFPINGYVQQYGNLDFFLNTVSYLMKDQDLIGIRPRELHQASLELTGGRMRQVVATIFLISGLFLLGGISAKRRKSA